MEKKRCYGCMRIKTSTPFCEHCGHDERNRNAPHQLPAGTVLREQYLVGKVLGQGGFGITYLGWDLYLDIPVAIKEYYPTGMVMRESTQTFSVINCLDDNGDRFHNNRDRFMREAKMLARFAYVPEIVQIKNFFLANNTAYIVMEYVQGITLKEYVRRRGGRLSVQETFAILQPIMVGLSKLHKAGLIHRDISPDNIMMLPGGGAKLLDFGAVRDVGMANVNQDLSRPTDAILKQGYAPIEQYQQKGALGPWSDVYALCATIYYCLTGTVPPDSPARMLEEEELKFDSRLGLERRYARALSRGMAIRAADRPRNMEELYRDLFGTPIPVEDDGIHPPQPEPPRPPVEPPRPPADPPKPQKGKGWIAAVAVLLIACGVGAWFLTRPKEARLADRIPTTEEYEATLPRPEETEGALPKPTEPPEETKPQEPTQPQRPVIKNAQENTLMEHMVDDVDTGPTTYAFGTSVTREQVGSITVLYTTKDAPASAVDASMNGNGKVLAWTEKNGEAYDLYLAAEGGIYAPANSEYLFAFFTDVKTIEFNDAFFTDNVENASAMFYRNTNLVEMDTGAFRTGKVTDMSWMFADCENLEALETTQFETGNVTHMNSMFQDCGSLHYVNVSNFDTGNVTTMRYMFTKCLGLERLDVSGFRTDQVTEMQYMFNGCSNVAVLNVSGFNTEKVNNMSNMFSRCSAAKSLDVSGFRTSNVTDMSGMFKDCFSVTRLDVSGFDTVRVTDMSNMFYGCSGVSTLDVSGFSTANVSDMHAMFYGCSGLTTLDVSNFKTGNVTDMSSMFTECGNLTVLDVSGFKTGNVTTMRAMFEGCKKVRELAVGGFDTGKVTDMSYMFNMCNSVAVLNMVDWNTINVTEMIAMFRDCRAMTRLTISTFNTRNVTSMARMFEDCSGLTYLNISGLETNNVLDMEYMFSGCSSLANLSVSSFSTAKLEDMQYMFHECRSLRSLDISHFDTSNVSNMNYTFYGCDSLTDLKLGNFETDQVSYHDSFMEPGKMINGKDWITLFS